MHTLVRILVCLALAVLALGPPGAASAGERNLALGKRMTASSHTDVYPAANANDGDSATYWESANRAFPQWIQVDLGAATRVNRLELRLPRGWPVRTQTLTVRGGADGSDLSTVVTEATYTFDPDTTIEFPEVAVRYIRLRITANTGWPAGQVSEFEIYGPGEDDPPPPSGTNLAAGKPVTASSHVHTYRPANAVDDDLTTYWESSPGHPSTLTVDLGADAELESVVVKLNPDPIWAARTQRIEVLGRERGADGFTGLAAARDYAFDPATGNSVTIPVDGTAAEVRLRYTGNSGAPGGQAAELQVYGTPAPGPDLSVTGLTASPPAPVETDEITLAAVVRNLGTAPSEATTVAFALGDDDQAATADVAGLPIGGTATVEAGIGTLDAGDYMLRATADPDDTVAEQDEDNNTYVALEPLVVTAADSSDLVASPVSWTPGSPAAGDDVAFSVAIKNQGNTASAGGSHDVTLTLTNEAGNVVARRTGSHTGSIAAGVTTAPIAMGSWTAADGTYTVTTEITADANELPVKRENNTSVRRLDVGRGAHMPYDMYEAEDGVTGGGAAVVGPNRAIGDPAGEASGRRAVTLDTTGAYVEFTTRAPTNTLVTRFSIPDAPGGGGIDADLNVYVDGSFHKRMPLTSKFAWLYGDEAAPVNDPSAGPPRHIYDEAHLMLDRTVPAGSTIRLRKDQGNDSRYAIDFINLERVAPVANPDPARYVEPDGFTHQDVQNALDAARMDPGRTGVYLPPGDYRTAQKFQVYGKAVKVVGAGPWYTRFHAPENQENTDVGFRADSSANGSTFAGFAYFGNYTTRIDGPGKVFDLQNVADMTIDNVWAEHQVCLYWGTNTDNMVIKNSRARNLFADALNMTNGSSGNLVTNVESRASGDDSFALFAATDAGGSGQTGNVYENLTSLLTWRAAGVAVYGGYGNTFRDIRVADTLVYSGITISSLDFGIPMEGFGADPPTRFENISIERAGGHFWGAQTFPAMWLFSASKTFQGIRVSDLDITDPTYHGIMFQTKYTGGQPENSVTDTVFTDVSITGARKSGDQFDDKSGFGIWANEMPEAGQGPAVGSVTFNRLTMADNHQNIKNTTSTFTININN